MLIRTTGMVLHTTNYSETSVITKIFTRQLGVRSYILKGVRSTTGRAKFNLLQPMSYLELVVYDNPKKQINFIKEIAPAQGQSAYETDPIVTSVRFFMAELLYKSLREDEPLPALFDYCAEVITQISQTPQAPQTPQTPLSPSPSPSSSSSSFIVHQTPLSPSPSSSSFIVPHTSAPGGSRPSLASLPILFQLSVLRHLGLEPMNNYSSHEPFFNLKEGRFMAPPSAFVSVAPENSDYLLDGGTSLHLHYYLEAITHTQPVPLLSHTQRSRLIETLIEYYRIHLADFGRFKSHEILHAVLA